jgi:cyanophycinase
MPHGKQHKSSSIQLMKISRRLWLNFMNSGRGAVALVGSGEYLIQMQEIEADLLHRGISRGKSNTYIQIPTGAGQESADRIEFWKERGAAQAERMGATCHFLPILKREDAFNPQYIEEVTNAGLIYFSGGDPGYITEVFEGTPLWEKIKQEFNSGSSLAGCSAGAMAFGSKIVGLRISHAQSGLGLIPEIEVIPHYDKFLGWVPDRIASIALRSDEGTYLLGIDEDTALVLTDKWRVQGRAKVHVLKGLAESPQTFTSGEEITLLHTFA